MGSEQGLEKEHAKEAIEKRIHGGGRISYLRDSVLGAIDGVVTTFAVISGSIGGGFTSEVALVLGLANLIADGFSMAVSNYEGTRSRQEEIEEARRSEVRQIKAFPEGEKAEVKIIFEDKGFSGDALANIVNTISRDRGVWVDTMMREELGIEQKTPNPYKAGFSTFAAFILVGLIPLIPFFFDLDMMAGFRYSMLVTAAAFFLVGIVKGLFVRKNPWFSGVGTLLKGAAAASLAFFVARLIKQ